MRALLAAILASFACLAPAGADQLLPQPQIDGSGNVKFRGGPTIGTVSGSVLDLSGMSVVPSGSAASGTLSRLLADRAPLASPTFSGTATVPTLALSGSGSTGDVSGMSVFGRTLQARAQDVANACDYAGANAGARIAAAIAALPASGGEVDARCLKGAQTITSPLVIGTPTKPVHLRLGAGTFTVGALVSVDKNSSVTGQPSALGIGGANGGTRFIAAAGSNLPAIIQLTGILSVLTDIVVDGNKAGNPSGGVGILSTGGGRTSLFRVTAQNAPSHGISVQSSAESACCLSILDVMSIDNGGSGLYAASANDMKIVHSEFERNGAYGIELSDSPALRVTLSDFGGNLAGGIKASGSPGGKSSSLMIVSSNQFGANSGHDIEIQNANGGSYGNAITGNSFISKHGPNGTVDNIHMQDSYNNTISGNFIATYAVADGQSRYGIAQFDSTGLRPHTDAVHGNVLVGPFTASPYFGVRVGSPSAENRIVNGSFAVDQYQEGAAYTFTSGYFIDRWIMLNNTGASWQSQGRTSATGCGGAYFGGTLTQNGATVTPAASGIAALTQRLDGGDVADLLPGNANAKPFRLTFWASSTAPGTYAIAFVNGAQNRSLVTTVNLTSTCRYFDLPVPADTGGSGANGWNTASGTVGMNLHFDLGTGADFQTTTLNVWQNGRYLSTPSAVALSANAGGKLSMNGIRLTQGSADVPPMARTVGEETRLAQQFYRKSFPPGTAPTQNAGLAGARCFKAPVAASFGSLQISFEQPMRKTPTITTFNPSAANANWRNVTAGSDVTVSVDPSGAKSPDGFQVATGAGLASANDNACIHFVASGEL